MIKTRLLHEKEPCFIVNNEEVREPPTTSPLFIYKKAYGTTTYGGPQPSCGTQNCLLVAHFAQF